MLLEINNLTKNFANVRALDNVSFNVDEGTITGILGPNGAGKTTLLRIVNGIVGFDSGSVLVDGRPASLKAARIIGYMPEERGLYDKMTVQDQIIYFGRLHGAEEREIRKVMGEYLDMFNIADHRNRKIKELSKGNQQKVQIISTIVHNPRLVILDEPFSGFDPINGAILSQLLRSLRERGATIILSSHNMPAIEEMCSDIALINHGHLLVKDSIENIKEAHRDNTLLLTTRQPLDEETLQKVSDLGSIEPTAPSGWRKGNAYRIRTNPGIRNADLLEAAAAAASGNSEIIHFEEALPSLKEIFINYTKES